MAAISFAAQGQMRNSLAMSGLGLSSNPTGTVLNSNTTTDMRNNIQSTTTGNNHITGTLNPEVMELNNLNQRLQLNRPDNFAINIDNHNNQNDIPNNAACNSLAIRFYIVVLIVSYVITEVWISAVKQHKVVLYILCGIGTIVTIYALRKCFLQTRRPVNNGEGEILYASYLSFVQLLILNDYIHRVNAERQMPSSTRRVNALSHEEIKCLSSEKFSGCSNLEADCNDNTCSICLLDYVIGDNLIVLNCDHRFHEACITNWLLIEATCPLCKTTVISTSSDVINTLHSSDVELNNSSISRNQRIIITNENANANENENTNTITNV